MRIWSLHPKYLDTKGLVALWRESLLAKHVLTGQTKGYKNHPQLNRFKNSENPVDCINQYLAIVFDESMKRAYNFNKEKIDWNFFSTTLNVTEGQLEFEKFHLLRKLKNRDCERYEKLQDELNWDSHPLFNVIPGNIEDWEVVLSIEE